MKKQEKPKEKYSSRAVHQWPQLADAYAVSFGHWTQHTATQSMRRSAP